MIRDPGFWLSLAMLVALVVAIFSQRERHCWLVLGLGASLALLDLAGLAQP